MIEDAAAVLHHAPSGALAAARRAATPVWLEAASFRRSDRTLVLYFMSDRPGHAHVEVAVDAASGLVFNEAMSSSTSSDGLDAVLARVNERLAAAGSSRAAGGPPTLMHVVALLLRELAAAADSVWPPPPPTAAPSLAPLLAAHVSTALLAASAHPHLAPSPSTPRSLLVRLDAALAGLTMQIAALGTALATLRRQAVLHPVPPFALLRGRSGGGGAAGFTASSQQQQQLGSQRDFDERLLGAAVAGLPPPWRLTAAVEASLRGGAPAAKWSDAAARNAAAAALARACEPLPLPSLQLLHYLCCLAPTRLVRLRRVAGDATALVAGSGSSASATTEGGSSGSGGGAGGLPPPPSSSHLTVTVSEEFAVVTGPPPADWLTCAHNGSSSGDGTSAGGHCTCAGSGLRVWDERAALAHGVLTSDEAAEDDDESDASHDGGSSAGRVHRHLRLRRPAPLALYHGSSSDNAYSILANGLRSLSGTRHEASGAIHGDGVYLSNELAVAQSFGRAVGTTWAHLETSLLLRRVGLPGGSGSGEGDAGDDSDDDDVTAAGGRADVARALGAPCRWQPVVVCEAVAAPSNRVFRGGKPVAPAASGGAAAASAPAAGTSIPAGCYLVVPDPAHLRITRLLVTHELPRATATRFGRHRRGAGAAAGPTQEAAGQHGPGSAVRLLLAGAIALLVLIYFSTGARPAGALLARLRLH